MKWIQIISYERRHVVALLGYEFAYLLSAAPGTSTTCGSGLRVLRLVCIALLLSRVVTCCCYVCRHFQGAIGGFVLGVLAVGVS